MDSSIYIVCLDNGTWHAVKAYSATEAAEIVYLEHCNRESIQYIFLKDKTIK
jgi:hypothetical protein